MAGFGHIQREHLPSQVASAVGQEIDGGALKAGDKLPTEHELARAFGVSRAVVREAIAQLRNEGLVETRQGVGAFVLPSRHRPVLRIAVDNLSDQQRFRSLFQLRVPLEVEAAGLAALHHAPDDLQRLDESLEAMGGLQAWSSDEGIAADLSFHRTLAQATQNHYFPAVLGFVGEKITTTIVEARSLVALEQLYNRTVQEHRAVRDAVAARDMHAARAAMRAHILGAASRLNLQLEDPSKTTKEI
jgi:DNA-binding FadR family transcriptional regulator